MRYKTPLFLFFVLLIAFSLPASAQFTSEETAEFEKWERFLEEAEIIEEDQPWGEKEAVTKPWLLTLEKDGITKQAVWKNAQGRMGGFIENWKWEIAAYQLSKALGLDMVPPTVEKRLHANRGSCQLFIDHMMTLKQRVEDDVKMPSYKVFNWNRALYLQRAFDNLIANEDRHQNQYLILEDWRMVLIDHSRSFRISKKFTTKLIYNEKYREGKRLMRELPRTFVEKLKTLDFASVKEAVGEYLTDKEIEAVLLRRDLILDWLKIFIEKQGEDKVLY